MEVTATDAPAEITEGTPGRSRQRYGTGMLVLATVAGLLLGYAVALLTLRPSTPGDTSPEAGFARDMTIHHDQAVTMAMIAYQRATHLSVRTVGEDIAGNQQGQIGMMQQWLRDWDVLPTGSRPPMSWMPDGAAALQDGLMPGMATPEELAELRAATGVEVDRLFLELMVDHHLGGIHMVDAILEVSDHEDVRWLAQTQKNGQQQEITLMRRLLSELPAE
jgi:uncharacterized protein (DUF305 family)